jgi:hypothetical protein
MKVDDWINKNIDKIYEQCGDRMIKKHIKDDSAT